MSFEVYLQCFGQDERLGISRAGVRSLFPILEEESDPGRWRVRYDDKNICDISVTTAASDEAMLTDLSIHRPCGDVRLWEALFSILRMGSVVIFWPGSPPVVADDAIGANLPRDMTDAMGPPRSVRTAADILQLLRQT